MTSHFTLAALVFCFFTAVAAGIARAQSVGDALDSPSFEWTASEFVTALNDPALSHDGVDVVRIDAISDWESVKTTVTVPSVVEFWHRSGDLASMATLGRNREPVAISSSWKKVRWLQWGTTPSDPAELEIGNYGPMGGGPLFVDELSVSPAAQVSLAEALDFPGFIGSGDSVVGLAESWLAPDGVDAVVFWGSSMEATLPGPGLIRYHHGGGGESSVTVANGFGLGLLPYFVLGDTTWAWVASGGTYYFDSKYPSYEGSLFGRDPIVMDALGFPAAVPINEALDAPGLTFSVIGVAEGTEAPPGAPDGDAVLCLRSSERHNTASEVSLTISGPGIVRFTYLGTVSVQRTGQTGSDGGTATTWQTMDIPVYRNGETLTWSTAGGNGYWLTGVSVLPPTAETSIAGLLNAPGLIPEILMPAYVGATAGHVAGDHALQVAPIWPEPHQPVLRLPFSGASFVSLDVITNARDARFRIDGGAWQATIFSSNAPFRAIVPGDGPHALEVTGLVTIDHFHVMPLIAVPLADALDAPELTFTTSPELPWSGYAVPTGSGWSGNHAAFGGSHSTSGDPWIETQVTGPGILRSSADLLAVNSEVYPTPYFYPQPLIDGIAPDGYFSYAEVLIPPGVHSARWVQRGSRLQSAYESSLASLDAVSFEPLIPILIAAALETPNRAWNVGGAGTLTPVVWAGQSPDEVDSVHFESAALLDAAWLETEVNLPCTVSFRGKSISVSIGNGPTLFQLPALSPSASDPNGFNSTRKTLTGHGPARVRFTALMPRAVLDMVDFEEPDGRLLPAVTVGTPRLTWKLYGDQPWQVVPHEATGIDRYRAGLNAPVWMETVVTGPGQLFVPSATLPDHDNRPTDAGWIPYPGPQRVLVNRAANSLLPTTIFQSSPPIAAWTGSPDIIWTTGGDVPWQSTFEANVRSGLVWPGEVSWIEAALTGPGVLYWDSSITGSILRPEISCNGMTMAALAYRGWLHVGAGAHRLRWAMANPRDGSRHNTDALTLKNVAFTAQPNESVSSVLSSGTLSFYELPPNSNEPNPTTPLPWPSPTGWRIIDDATLPGPAVRGDGVSATLTAFLPARGRITSLLKTDGSIPPGATIPANGLVAAAAPFPWLPWSSTASFPQAEGVQTFVAQSAFVPDSPVSIAEALDQPDLNWTADSTPAGLWDPRATPDSSIADQDALHLGRAAMGDRAWLETTVTGPLRVTTLFDQPRSGTDADLRILVDDVLVVTDLISRSTSSLVNVPAGVHRLSWEITSSQPISAVSEIALRSITVGAGKHLDVPTLLDAPDLEWAITGTQIKVTTAVTTGTHDGIDALLLGENRLVIGLTGPGMVSFWIKSPEPPDGITLDSATVPITQTNTDNWIQYTLPIPHGRHSVTVSGNNTTVIDEFLFQGLSEVSAEAALDAPAGVTVSLPNPEMVGASAFPGLSDDGTDSLLLLPGANHRIALHVPPLSSLSLRVRAAWGVGTFGFQDMESSPTTTTWTTRNFSTPVDGGLTTVYLRADTVPVLLDSLIITTPPATTQYFPWAGAAGLGASQQGTDADPDGDGLSNFSEYAHGLDPTVPDAFRTGTETVPGLPEVVGVTDTDGLRFLEVRYWRRSQLSASVETAVQPTGFAMLGDPDGWTTSSNPPTSASHPDGWIRHVWRSPTPISAESQRFARVRMSMP